MAVLKTKNVFINCPYDKSYIQTLRPILFTVKFIGFNPRLAMESSDSGYMRINKILNLIKNCPYAIHDLSRLRSSRQKELFRMNMPFELGLDIGCRVFGGKEQKRKKCLVFEKGRHSLQAALSDLSNSDVYAHNDKPIAAVRSIRNWLIQEANISAPSGTEIWYAYNDFMGYLDNWLRKKGFLKIDIDTMPLFELLRHIDRWIKDIQQKGQTYHYCRGSDKTNLKVQI